ncbi:phosphatidylserine decarboxylase [Salinisphaera sp. T31B1]|uniref:phosphatidylserine decarboxylase n=1 Tax=Salinisphaera sp. T31B1 TaxID=727963 RepID=UPI00333E8217
MLVLTFQLAVIVLLALAVVLWAVNFPHPSPLARPLLRGKRRWPENQIRSWLASGDFHPGYLRYFYRDPERVAPHGDGLLAPADGLVTGHDCLDGVRYIVIALSFWDMHVQRSPIDGRVRSVVSLGDTHTDGEGRDFAFLRAKICPVQTRIVIDSDIGTVAVRLITSVAARRIEAWVEPGQTIRRGQRIGRILLGSTVVLEVPDAYQCTPALRTHVRAGQTVLVQRRRDGNA